MALLHLAGQPLMLSKEEKRQWKIHLQLKLLVGILGPGPTPLAGQTDPRVSKEKGPSTDWPTNAGPTLRPDISRGLNPDISRPMSARLTFCPGAWGFHIAGP